MGGMGSSLNSSACELSFVRAEVRRCGNQVNGDSAMETRSATRVWRANATVDNVAQHLENAWHAGLKRSGFIGIPLRVFDFALDATRGLLLIGSTLQSVAKFGKKK